VAVLEPAPLPAKVSAKKSKSAKNLKVTNKLLLHQFLYPLKPLFIAPTTTNSDVLFETGVAPFKIHLDSITRLYAGVVPISFLF
jgi:hypothetical protein